MSLLAVVDWNRLIAPQDAPFVVFLLFVAICVLTALGTRTWYKTQQLHLKDKMIERGFTPEEIVAVINAGRDAGRRPQVPDTPVQPANHPQAQHTPRN